jgi:hypothetical protein
MTPPPTNIDGTDITGATIDGQEVQEITVDGQTVFTAGPDIPNSGALHQWNFTEGSGTTVTDVNSNLDLGFTSISSWEAGVGTGNVYADLDGANDYVPLSDDTWDFFLDPAQGTLFFWCKPEFTGERRILVASDRDNTGNELYLVVDTRSSNQIRFVHTVASQYTNISGGDPANHVGEWIAVAAVANDSGTDKLYLATLPDYTVVEVANATGPSASPGTWDTPLNMYRRSAGNTEHWLGGADLAFVDDSPQTQAEIQQFVDDTKSFYV